MEKMIGIIFNAKKASETFITQQTGKPTTIFLDNYEDLQHDITVSLRTVSYTHLTLPTTERV
mgnify:CR=1 FL=1